MGYYTKFYFRAKLRFDLPEPIRAMLRKQAAGPKQESYAILVGETAEETDAPEGLNWSGWEQVSSHPFFTLGRAFKIPGMTGPQVYREYPDGSSHLEFTVELKNIGRPIQEFVDWIKPYVREKYGKRSRMRKRKNRVWVGYMKPEDYSGRIDFFIEPAPSPEQDFSIPGLPGYPGISVTGTMCNRAVVEDWCGRFV